MPLDLTPDKMPYYTIVSAGTGTGQFKQYTALITQTSTDAPILNILQNTIGNIIWTRSSEGLYIGTLTGAFTLTKTYITITNNDSDAANTIVCSPSTTNTITLTTRDTGVLTDALLNETPIEIKIYT